jgi:hypothetical protein
MRFVRWLAAHVETPLGRSVEWPFIRMVPKSIHQIELQRKLEHAMDLQVSRTADMVLAPNLFELHLGEEDYHRFAAYQKTLLGELQLHLLAHSDARGYVLPATPVVLLILDGHCGVGDPHIVTRFVEMDALPEVVLSATFQMPKDTTAARDLLDGTAEEVPGDQDQEKPLDAYVIIDPLATHARTMPLDRPLIRIGRHSENEICLVSPHVSRHHCVIRRESLGYVLYDLHSLTGTHTNGLQEHEAGVLHEGDCIEVGDHVLVFHLQARSSSLDSNGTST